MSQTDSAFQRSLRLKTTIIRVTAVLSMLYSIMYLLTSALLLTGALSAEDKAIQSAAFFLLWSSVLPFALMFLMAFFGFRAARDRFRMLPFCIVSWIYAVLTVGSMVLTGFASVTQALQEGITGIVTLLFIVLDIAAAISATLIVRYNRSHPRGFGEAAAAQATDGAKLGKKKALESGATGADGSEKAAETDADGDDEAADADGAAGSAADVNDASDAPQDTNAAKASAADDAQVEDPADKQETSPDSPGAAE